MPNHPQHGTPDDSRPEGSFDVIGLGVSTLDLMMVVDELPGEELVQRAHASLLQGGGPVATAIVALSRLGARVAMVDSLGDDWRGNAIVEEFHRERVATHWIVRTPGRSSSLASILVRKCDGARTIAYHPGDGAEVDPGHPAFETIRSAKILHLNGRHLPASLVAAEKARAAGVRVSFDGGAHRYDPSLLPLLDLTDICIVARQFACACSGSDDLDRSAAFLLNRGIKILVITAGTDGSWVFTNAGENFHQPPFRTEATVDTTGAGDAYHGGFLFGIVRGYPLKACARFAAAVAAMNTQALGGRTALPSLAQAQRFLQQGSPAL